jgi:hypothetical protein
MWDIEVSRLDLVVISARRGINFEDPVDLV